VPTFLFDGDCAFCSSCARFIERHIHTDTDVVAWQFADLDRLGVTADACMAAVQFVEPGKVPSVGPDAVADLLKRATNPLWRLAGRVLAKRTTRALARPVYRWVADNRHRLPGGTAACKVNLTTRAGGHAGAAG
jgi:predicted DCC family thiol-disulfide oxidoreductase YuxK